MNIKPIYILYYGLLGGYIVGFLSLLSISLSGEIRLSAMNWLNLVLFAIALFAIKLSTDRIRDMEKLALAEKILLALNIAYVLVALIILSMAALTSGIESYLVIFIAFGSPSIFALILWKLRTR